MNITTPQFIHELRYLSIRIFPVCDRSVAQHGHETFHYESFFVGLAAGLGDYLRHKYVFRQDRSNVWSCPVYVSSHQVHEISFAAPIHYVQQPRVAVFGFNISSLAQCKLNILL
jgi:hypothetical protein